MSGHRKYSQMLIGLVFLAGCAGYKTAAGPWRDFGSGEEFDAALCPKIGDRARVDTLDKRRIEGVIVEIDSLAITLTDLSTDQNAVELPVTEVANLEVYAPSPWRHVRNLALVTAGAVAAYVVVDEITQPAVFEPHWEPAKLR